jgi:hypothetical protein
MFWVYFLFWRDMSAIAWIWLFMILVPITTRFHRILNFNMYLYYRLHVKFRTSCAMLPLDVRFTQMSFMATPTLRNGSFFP